MKLINIPSSLVSLNKLWFLLVGCGGMERAHSVHAGVSQMQETFR